MANRYELLITTFGVKIDPKKSIEGPYLFEFAKKLYSQHGEIVFCNVQAWKEGLKDLHQLIELLSDMESRGFSFPDSKLNFLHMLIDKYFGVRGYSTKREKLHLKKLSTLLLAVNSHELNTNDDLVGLFNKSISLGSSLHFCNCQSESILRFILSDTLSSIDKEKRKLERALTLNADAISAPGVDFTGLNSHPYYYSPNSEELDDLEEKLSYCVPINDVCESTIRKVIYDYYKTIRQIQKESPTIQIRSVMDVFYKMTTIDIKKDEREFNRMFKKNKAKLKKSRISSKWLELRKKLLKSFPSHQDMIFRSYKIDSNLNIFK